MWGGVWGVGEVNRMGEPALMLHAHYTIPRCMLDGVFTWLDAPARKVIVHRAELDAAEVAHDPSGAYWRLYPGGSEPATWRSDALSDATDRIAEGILRATGRPGFYVAGGGAWTPVSNAQSLQLQQLCARTKPSPAGILRVADAAVCEVRAVTDPHHPARRGRPDALAFGVWARTRLYPHDIVMCYSHGALMGPSDELEARLTTAELQKHALYLADCGELPAAQRGEAGVPGMLVWGNPLATAACLVNDHRNRGECSDGCPGCAAYAGRRSNIAFRTVLQVDPWYTALHYVVEVTRSVPEGGELLLDYGLTYWEHKAIAGGDGQPQAAARPRKRAASPQAGAASTRTDPPAAAPLPPAPTQQDYVRRDSRTREIWAAGFRDVGEAAVHARDRVAALVRKRGGRMWDLELIRGTHDEPDIAYEITYDKSGGGRVVVRIDLPHLWHRRWSEAETKSQAAVLHRMDGFMTRTGGAEDFYPSDGEYSESDHDADVYVPPPKACGAEHSDQ